jgi:hypothetical protein
MSSKKLSRDQKRRAKLAERKRRQKPAEPLPYEGQKYRADAYLPYVFRTETAVLEAYLESDRKLTNEQVRQAFVQLIERLRHHSLAVIAEVEPEAQAEPGTVEDVVLRIRRGWQDLFTQRQPCSRDDMIGILRMLLFSIEAQGWNSGPGRGYLVFLEKFLTGMT